MADSPTRRYSPRRTREERHEQLLDAALTLVDTRGFEGFSIEAVAREAGVTKTVVYGVWPTREEILRSLLDREMARCMQDVAEAFPQPPFAEPAELVRDALAGILERVHAHPQRWRLIALSSDGVPLSARETMLANRAQLLQQIKPLVGYGQESLGLAELDAGVATEMILAGFEHMIRMTLTAPEAFTPQRLVAFFEGVRDVLERGQ